MSVDGASGMAEGGRIMKMHIFDLSDERGERCRLHMVVPLLVFLVAMIVSFCIWRRIGDNCACEVGRAIASVLQLFR